MAEFLYQKGGNSTIVGFIPVLVVLILLGIVRRPAWQAALAGLIAGLIIAIAVWGMPLNLAVSSTLNGFAFALVAVIRRVFLLSKTRKRGGTTCLLRYSIQREILV
jgi:L-lactate permease